MTEKNENLLAKLDEIENRFRDIETQISDPVIATNTAKLISLSKEMGKLKSLVEKYREYKSAIAGIEDAKLIVAGAETDADFKAMAEEEIVELEQKSGELIEQIKDTLVMADDAAIDSIIIEIRAGTGGEEAALFVRDLLGMYTRYAEKRRWKVE